MNSHSPRMYCNGSPLSRRAMAVRSQSSSADASRKNFASISASAPAAGAKAAASSRLVIRCFPCAFVLGMLTLDGGLNNAFPLGAAASRKMTLWVVFSEAGRKPLG